MFQSHHSINPTIQSIAVHPCNGYSLVLQKSEENCPSQNSFFYALWNEKSSCEKIGWYLAKVLSIDDNGNVTLRYRSGNNIEEVSLLSIDWSHAKGNGKWFLPPNTLSIPSKLSPSTHSKPHKVKGYADDLTIITSSCSDHQEVLSQIDKRCSDVCLTIRPDKCLSLVIGSCKNNKTVFKVADVMTNDIKNNIPGVCGR